MTSCLLGSLFHTGNSLKTKQKQCLCVWFGANMELTWCKHGASKHGANMEPSWAHRTSQNNTRPHSYLQREVPADLFVGFPSLAARLFVHIQSPTQLVEPGSSSLRRLVLVAHLLPPSPRAFKWRLCGGGTDSERLFGRIRPWRWYYLPTAPSTVAI